jgi:rhamnulose-1-phosphate aldolase
MVSAPYPELDELLRMMGEAGKRLSELEATEGAAGNLSVCLRWRLELAALFPVVEEVPLPQPVPELAGAVFLVTGSGRRLREVIDEPAANIGAVCVDSGGRTGKLFTSRRRRFERLTSEFNSHLAVHYDQMLSGGTNFHAVIHAQPPHLTYLSHIPRYREEGYLNAHLLRWQPETVVNLPEGIGFVPFRIPGSPELMQGTVDSLRRHRIVVWAKHGAMARSDVSVNRAVDRVEYAEVAAKYEYFNLCDGEIAEGLTAEELRGICQAFDVRQSVFPEAT